jgi:hypothetical protein
MPPKSLKLSKRRLCIWVINSPTQAKPGIDPAPNRTAQIALANYTIIRASIPGDPGITAGRTINFNLYTLKPTNNKKDLDKFYSGKYLVTAVRHIILPQGLYQTILELAKDSSATTYQNIKNTASQKSAIKL